MARPEKMPEIVFIGPAKCRAKHRYCLFRVLSKHKDGTPKTCELLRENTTYDIEGGEEFMTAYLPAQMIKG